MIGDVNRLPGSREVRTAHSYCRLCNAQCGILVDVEDDRVTRVRGDRAHPLSRGYLCSKGRALPDLHHDPAGLIHPLVRSSSGLRAASWEVALDAVAGRVAGIIDDVGPDAVGAFRATHWGMDAAGRWMTERFFARLGTRQLYSSVTIDAPNKTLVPYLVTGTPYLFPLVDWERSRLVILVGQNTVVSHGHGTAVPDPITRIRAVRTRGGTVVVVDPRTTETAALADLHLQTRPGTDAALLAYLVREVLRDGCEDEYVARCVDPASVERLRAATASCTDDAAAHRCGVPVEQLHTLARLVRTAGRLSIVCGTGISMSATPNAGELLAWSLAALTGSLDRPRGMQFNPGVLRPQERRLTTRPRDTGPAMRSRPDLRHQFGEYPCAGLADEILAGELRALFVVGGNPVLALPDSQRTVTALRALRGLFVADTTRTATTDLADVVLPVTDTLERPDVTSPLDLAYPMPFAQYTERVVAPRGERRALWWVFAELGVRLGLFGKEEPISDEDSVLRRMAHKSRVPYDVLREAPSGVLDEAAPPPGWIVPDRLPAGRLDIAPTEIVDELSAWISADHLPDSLVLVNRRLPRQVNSTLTGIDRQVQRPPHPTLLIHPDDAARRQLADGDVARVRSCHGATTARCELDRSIRPGVVSLPHCWSDPDVNRLTSAHAGIDPLTGMVRLSGIPVTVEAATSPVSTV